MAKSSSASMTIFNNEKINELVTSIENFSRKLAEKINTNSEREEVFMNLFEAKSYRYTQYPCDMYLDIYSMADLYSDNPDKELSAAAENLKKKVEESTINYTVEGNAKNGIGINFIPLISAHVTAASHSDDYIKNQNNYLQNAFIQDSQWWVPSYEGNSGSLLDKLFYTVY